MIKQLMNFIHNCLEFWTSSPSERAKPDKLEEIVVIEGAYYDAQTEKWIHAP
jgi:hypothetical protein